MSDIVNYELPPVDVTTWTDWYPLWALANRFNLLAGQAWEGATDAETYQNLVTIINDSLNGTTKGSLLPVVKQGSTLLPAVSQNAQYALMAINPTDPANVGSISAQPLEGIVTGGGSIGAVLGTVSGGSYGAVKRTVAVLSVASILATTIGAFQMAQEKIDDLLFSVDPFVDENDNVITYTDENGKTYLPHDFIEAIRQKLIEMGAYSDGDFEPQQAVITSTATIADPVNPADVVQWYIDWRQSHGTPSWYLYQGVFNAIPDAMNQCYAESGVTDGIFLIKSMSTYNTLYLSYYPNVKKGSVLSNQPYGYPETANEWRIYLNTDGVIKKHINGNYDGTYGITPDTSFTSTFASTYIVIPDNMSARDILCAGTQVNPVEGITIQDGATVPSDPNQTLEDYFPAWTAQGKVFNTVTLGSDRAVQSIGETTFLPATLKDVQPFDEGTTQDQTQAQAGTPQDAPSITDNLLPAIQEFIENIIKSPDIPTPTVPAGDSGDTPPENPPLTPPSDATGSNGLWSIYNPSLQNVNDFGAWLWSDTLADQFKRIFNSPIDGVIGFHMLYCTPTTGTAKPIKCGFLQSPVSAPVVTNPYVEINCGTVSIGEYYGNALDYDNTRISVYLPFVGIVPLDTNIVMGSDINITYRVDVLTGTCLAQIKVLKENSDAVMYAFDGNCAVQIPLTATTYTGMVGALLGGLSAGASIMTGNMVQAIGSGMRALASGMTGLSGAKQSGTFGANVGALGIRIPYVIITHPVSAMPYQFNKLEGLPSNTTVRLGSLSGYTRVRSVHLENIGNATQEEIQMIQEQLEQGVII